MFNIKNVCFIVFLGAQNRSEKDLIVWCTNRQQNPICIVLESISQCQNNLVAKHKFSAWQCKKQLTHVKRDVIMQLSWKRNWLSKFVLNAKSLFNIRLEARLWFWNKLQMELLRVCKKCIKAFERKWLGVNFLCLLDKNTNFLKDNL